jgi:predicted nuclease of restriction endonuclease-like (RecB) superfamily
MKKMSFLFLGFCICFEALAQQENPSSLSKQELFIQIAHLDSVLFAAYNSENLELMKTFFTEDLEWYQRQWRIDSI